MKRLRALAALLGCLAILAGSVTTVAAATAAQTAVDRGVVGADPCSHCDDCGGVPCPEPMAACLQAVPTATPAIAAAMTDLPAAEFHVIHWSIRATTLSGLSPPPDPLPPRA